MDNERGYHVFVDASGRFGERHSVHRVSRESRNQPMVAERFSRKENISIEKREKNPVIPLGMTSLVGGSSIFG
jgi:hypothetical protein